MKDWKQGTVSDEPTCELPANARRMQAAGEKRGRGVRTVYGRCEDLDCSGSVSVRVSASGDDSGPYSHVGIWHDGKWFSGGVRGELGIGYRAIMASLNATPDVGMLDSEAMAA